MYRSIVWLNKNNICIEKSMCSGTGKMYNVCRFLLGNATKEKKYISEIYSKIFSHGWTI